MKKLFIFLNIVLFLCFVALLAALFTHQAPPPEKVLQQTPKIHNNLVTEEFIPLKTPINPSALAIITDNDLFAPSRGMSEDSKKNAAEMPKKTQFELTGICTMGLIKGAIIVNTASRREENKKQFYTVGDQISDTAYRLIDISPEEETAIIGVGSSQFMIKLDRADQGSLRRRDKGDAESKTLISLTKVPDLPPAPAPPEKTEPPKTEEAKPAEESEPVKPPVPEKPKTPEEMKKIRQEILQKMMSRRNQNQNQK